MATSLRSSLARKLNYLLGSILLLSFNLIQAQGPVAGFTLLNPLAPGCQAPGHYYYISEVPVFGVDIAAKVNEFRSLTGLPASLAYATAIANAAENTCITNMLKAYNQLVYGSQLVAGPSPSDVAGFPWGDPHNAWIGYTDAGSEQTWFWSNGQQNCNNFTNWNYGEPNDFPPGSAASNGEDYAEILLMQPYSFVQNPNLPTSPHNPVTGTMVDPLGRWNDWFNQFIQFSPGNLGGPTSLKLVIEVGPTECRPLEINLTGQTGSCYGQDNGTASFSVTAGVPPFTYKLDDGEETPFGSNAFNIADLDAGEHTLVIKDATGQTKTINFTISQPGAPLDATSSLLSNVKCNGGSDGSVTISATGGTPGYMVKKDGEATSYPAPHTYTGLTAMAHTFVVTDANGCTDPVTVVISEPSKLVPDADDRTPACNGNNGSVTISATGGTPGYKVKRNGDVTSYDAPHTFTGLAPGGHTFIVTDANGCSASISVTIDGTGVGGGFNVMPETFPNQFNTSFTRSLVNKTFVGSSGTWTVNSDENATMVVTTPYYSPSSSYALKVVNFKTYDCGNGWAKAVSPKLNLTGPCCPDGVKMNFTLWTYNVVNGDTKARLEIDFSNDNGTTWTEVWSKTSNELYDSYGANGKTMINIPVPVIYQTANFRYRIRGEMDGGDYNNFYLFIDDINITSPAVCTPTPLGSIGNLVWNDLNGNGKQDAGEPGIANASVKLTRPDASTTTTTTNASGIYGFTGLAAGNYTVTFTTPGGYVPTLANQGVDDAIDSDPVGGVVAVSLAAGQVNNTIDAGFKIPVCTNTTNHTETFPNKFNSYFTTSLYNKTFIGSSGTWTINSDEKATMVVTTPYYSPSSSYALKVVQYKTTSCGSSWSKAVSPKVDLSDPCCPSELKMAFTLWTYKVVNGDYKAKLEIDFSSNNGATWTEVWSKTSNQLYDSYGANGKTVITIPVPVGYQNSNFRYRIRGSMESGDCNNFYVFIDDIKIGSPATCSTSSPYARTTGSETKGETSTGETAKGRQPVEATEEIKVDFGVSVFPNPTNAEFELRLSSKEIAPATVKVVDMLGRIVKSMRISSNQSVRFGSELKSGNYIVEVTQGESKEVIKLVKL